MPAAWGGVGATPAGGGGRGGRWGGGGAGAGGRRGLAGGVAAFAAKMAVGVSSVGPPAVGEFASGSHVLLWGDGLTAPEVQTFLLEHHPDLWRPLLRLLTEIGAHIK